MLTVSWIFTSRFRMLFKSKFELLEDSSNLKVNLTYWIKMIRKINPQNTLIKFELFKSKNMEDIEVSKDCFNNHKQESNSQNSS
jgi:hypothetical protein